MNEYMETRDFQFLKSDEYLQDLTTELNYGFTHLKIICFKFINRKILKSVLPAIKENLLNGSTFELHIDGIHSYHRIEAGLFPPATKDEKLKEKARQEELQAIYDELRSCGAKIYFFNKPDWINLNLIPFSGRDHRKLTVISRDNGKDVVYFGATNFQDANDNDFMLKVTNPDLIKIIEDINDQMKFATYSEDQERVYKENKLLLDIGNHFKSIIEKNAYEMLQNSKLNSKIVFISQLPPEPILLWKFIQASKNGAEVSIILPIEEHNQISGFPFNIAYFISLFIAKLFKFHIYHYKEFIHAKILLVDEQVVLGSHNLSTVGVMAGTVEFSMRSKDEFLVADVKKFINDLIIDSKKKIL